MAAVEVDDDAGKYGRNRKDDTSTFTWRNVGSFLSGIGQVLLACAVVGIVVMAYLTLAGDSLGEVSAVHRTTVAPWSSVVHGREQLETNLTDVCAPLISKAVRKEKKFCRARPCAKTAPRRVPDSLAPSCPPLPPLALAPEPQAASSSQLPAATSKANEQQPEQTRLSSAPAAAQMGGAPAAATESTGSAPSGVNGGSLSGDSTTPGAGVGTDALGRFASSNIFSGFAAAGASDTGLPKRPPRRPPAWDWSKGCLPPRPTPAGTGTGDNSGSPYYPFLFSPPDEDVTGTNAITQEARGATLLGPCQCPLLNPSDKPYADWAFECGDWDWRILSELAPWHGATLSREAMDLAYNLNTANIPPTYHISINQNRVYMRMQGPLSVYHDRLLNLLQTAAETVRLPDVEFVLHLWDHPKVLRQDPVPVFGGVRGHGHNDISFIHPYLWENGGPAVHPPSSANCPPFEQRDPRLLWRGSCMGPIFDFQGPLWEAYVRPRANRITAQFPGDIDAGVTSNCAPGTNNKPLDARDTFDAACTHKYLLLLDGNSISGRSSRLLNTGSVLFKADSAFSEFWYHLLQPWVNYVPIREHLEDMADQVQWLKANPHAEKCIREGGAQLAKRVMNRQTWVCYMWRLLSAFKRLQPWPSRTDLDGFSRIV